MRGSALLPHGGLTSGDRTLFMIARNLSSCFAQRTYPDGFRIIACSSAGAGSSAVSLPTHESGQSSSSSEGRSLALALRASQLTARYDAVLAATVQQAVVLPAPSQVKNEIQTYLPA